jgi:hypothetical protein
LCLKYETVLDESFILQLYFILISQNKKSKKACIYEKQNIHSNLKFRGLVPKHSARKNYGSSEMQNFTRYFVFLTRNSCFQPETSDFGFSIQNYVFLFHVFKPNFLFFTFFYRFAKMFFLTYRSWLRDILVPKLWKCQSNSKILRKFRLRGNRKNSRNFGQKNYFFD